MYLDLNVYKLNIKKKPFYYEILIIFMLLITQLKLMYWLYCFIRYFIYLSYNLDKTCNIYLDTI